jgi:hypothetical protein
VGAYASLKAIATGLRHMPAEILQLGFQRWRLAQFIRDTESGVHHGIERRDQDLLRHREARKAVLGFLIAGGDRDLDRLKPGFIEDVADRAADAGLVKHREMMSVGNAAVSGSMNSSWYSSENREAPNSRNSSSKNSCEMRGRIEAGTFT